MLAIPNIEKPKECAECFYRLRCKAIPRWLTADFTISSDCPLIEIVTCGECKWAKKEGDEGEGNLTCACHIPRFIVPSDGFCYLGERGADEGTTE